MVAPMETVVEYSIGSYILTRHVSPNH